MILIVGGTGRLGRELVSRLTRAGHRVRVLTRDSAQAEGLDVDLAIGDVRDPATLSQAMNEISVVISAAHGFIGGRGAGPEEVDDRGNANVIAAAREAGVEHVVLLSTLDARADHPMSLHRSKYAAEQHLRNSGLAWTTLRPSAYVETWIDIIGVNLPSGPALVFGRAENPINFVSMLDVASLVERSITDPSLRGQAIDVPGPDNLTMTQLAHHLGATKIRRIPRGALRFLSVAVPAIAPAFARQTRAALVMDTTDMTANADALRTRFPDISWHPATTVAAAHLAAGSPIRVDDAQ